MHGPDAQDLVAIRNHLEHKHLTVHENRGSPRDGVGYKGADKQSFAIDRPDLRRERCGC